MKVNSFRFEHSRYSYIHVLDDVQTEDLVAQLTAKNAASKAARLVYDRHMYYLDWKKFVFNPSLINIVRDPVQRFISKYYYMRSRKRWGNRDRCCRQTPDCPPAHCP